MTQYVCCFFRAPVLTAQLASWSGGRERIKIKKISQQKDLATDTYRGASRFSPLQHVAFSAKASSVHTIWLLRASMPRQSLLCQSDEDPGSFRHRHICSSPVEIPRASWQDQMYRNQNR